MSTSTDKSNPVVDLYHRLIDAWNGQNAKDFAGLFAEDGNCIGFDGSQLIGKKMIESSLKDIFDNHPTAAYVTVIRQTQTVGDEVGMLRTNVGMVPPGKKDIEPARNAIQCLVAQKKGESWQIISFQNTPAQFHGRPDLTDALNKELRSLL